jgi:hypothetical protein
MIKMLRTLTLMTALLIAVPANADVPVEDGSDAWIMGNGLPSEGEQAYRKRWNLPPRVVRPVKPDGTLKFPPTRTPPDAEIEV